MNLTTTDRTCRHCDAKLLPRRGWRALDQATRDNLRSQGYDCHATRGLCSRCRQRAATAADPGRKARRATAARAARAARTAFLEGFGPEDAYPGQWRRDGLIWKPVGITAADRFGDVIPIGNRPGEDDTQQDDAA